MYGACVEDRGISRTGSPTAVSQPAEAASNLRLPEADLDPMMSEHPNDPKPWCDFGRLIGSLTRDNTVIRYLVGMIPPNY